MTTRPRNYPAAQALIDRAMKVDPALAADIRAFARSREYGLVFEHNRPEAMRLYGKPINVGDVVHVLPVRGEKESDDNRIEWRVLDISESIASLAQVDDAEATCEAHIDDVVVVAEYDQPIYAGLQETGRVERGDGTLGNPGDKPYHVVINGENYHALEALEFCYAGKVDCIYIDPPYNTGDKNWKYNNNYVDGTDAYRHSKWLAWMERRLKLAKSLLNPENSVLILTIDEREYLRVGLLLEQVFTGATIQMVSSVINPTGAIRGGQFARTDEYLFFVWLGECRPRRLPLSAEWRTSKTTSANEPTWRTVRRRGSHDTRTERPNSFYPIYIERETGRIIECGESLDINDDYRAIISEDPAIEVVFPLKPDGEEGCWQISAETIGSLLKSGYVRCVSRNRWGWIPTYLASGEVQKVETGVYDIVGRGGANNEIQVASAADPSFIPGSQWRISSHNAREYGSNMITNLVGKRDFDYPKSLYAVEDALRFFVSDKPNALVVDFFAGSGTTAHAVMRLNHQDGGHRRCICITNNEVSEEEERKFTSRGLRQGDEEWEARGIARYITIPRISAAITGLKPDGETIAASCEYFPCSTTIEYKRRTITQINYVDLEIMRSHAKKDIAKKKKLLSLLAKGSLTQSLLDNNSDYAIADSSEIAILFNDSAAEDWLEALDGQDQIKLIYIITDNNALFRQIKSDIEDLLGEYEEEVPLPFPMADGFDENAVFFDLTYEDPELVEFGVAFAEIAPLLWMRAGCSGRVIEQEETDFATADNYAVLFDYAYLNAFARAIEGNNAIETVFVVTDDDHRYANAKKMFPGRDVVRLYESYLHSFQIANEGALS